MKKQSTFDFTILLLGMAIALILLATSCSKMEQPVNEAHQCRWEDCPYKGIMKGEYREAVIEYVGNDLEGSDGYCIDMLHLQYPNDEYDQLEDRLFSAMK